MAPITCKDFSLSPTANMCSFESALLCLLNTYGDALSSIGLIDCKNSSPGEVDSRTASYRLNIGQFGERLNDKLNAFKLAPLSLCSPVDPLTIIELVQSLLFLASQLSRNSLPLLKVDSPKCSCCPSAQAFSNIVISSPIS